MVSMPTETEVVLAGPGIQEYASLLDQSHHFLDSYWQNWRNYLQPESYVLPPAFKFKNPELSDARMDNPPSISADMNISHQRCRQGDVAEKFVYDALQQLAADKFRSPILAFHNVDIEWMKSNNYVANVISPCVGDIECIDKGVFREYDFLVLGREIGIYNIEVKSHAVITQKSLQQLLAKAITQLKAGHALFELAEEMTGIKLGIKAIGVLVLPSMDKTIFEDTFKECLSTLEDRERKNAMDYRKHGVKVLFKQDVYNSSEYQGKFMLYTTFKNLFKTGTPISKEAYEAHAALIAGMSSITRPIKDSNLEMSKEKFSKLAAAIENSSLMADTMPVRPTVQAGVKKNSKEDKKSEKEQRKYQKAKMLFLSPDQQKALCGKERQLIFGAAGTGKSIVIQEKACALLRQNQAVTVFASEYYMRRYKEIFDLYGFKNYTIRRWHYEILAKISIDAFGFHVPAHHYDPEEGTTYLLSADAFDSEARSKFMSATNKMQAFIDYTDRKIKTNGTAISKQVESLLFGRKGHIFIDDYVDSTYNDSMIVGKAVFYALYLAQIAKKYWPNRYFWIAMDPSRRRSFETSAVYTTPTAYATGAFEMEQVYYQLMDEIMQTSHCKTVLSTVTLKHVMRCSESVFQAAYSPDLKWCWGNESVLLGLGHKVLGCDPTVIHQRKKGMKDAAEAAKATLAMVKQRFIDEDIDLSSVGVVVCVSQAVQCNGYFNDLGVGIKEHDFREPVFFSDTKLPVSKNESAIYRWRDVSSLEWPVVIFLSCLPVSYESSDKGKVAYERYRAISRGKALVIEIIATYSKLPSPKEEVFDIRKVMTAGTFPKDLCYVWNGITQEFMFLMRSRDNSDD